MLGTDSLLNRNDDLKLLLLGNELLDARLDLLKCLKVGSTDQTLVGRREIGRHTKIQGIDHIGTTEIEIDVGGQAKLPQQVLEKYSVVC